MCKESDKHVRNESSRNKERFSDRDTDIIGSGERNQESTIEKKCYRDKYHTVYMIQ